MESIHATLRRDHLVVEVFFSGFEAQLKTGIYRNDTKQLRPQSAVGYKAPAEVATMKAGTLMVPLGYHMAAVLGVLIALAFLEQAKRQIVEWKTNHLAGYPYLCVRAFEHR